VTFDWATVGNPCNAADPLNSGSIPGIGSVSSTYRIAKHEVTNAQYAEFLNAVAASDPNNLDSSGMDITRSGVDGSFTYAAQAGAENQPVAYVSWFDAARFANWLHNGQGMGSTETGAYDMTIPTPVRLSLATVFLPSENEWYKAAYHDPRGSAAAGPPGDDNYWMYPTQSDTTPTAEAPPGGMNSANYALAVFDFTDVGAYTGTTSFYGAFDMGGNVWEWHEGIPSPGFRGLRGESWGGGGFGLRSSGQLIISPADEGDDFAALGFRVASIPEPATCSLMLIALAAFGWRRRRG